MRDPNDHDDIELFVACWILAFGFVAIFFANELQAETLACEGTPCFYVYDPFFEVECPPVATAPNEDSE